jgi:hypothetical protein
MAKVSAFWRDGPDGKETMNLGGAGAIYVWYDKTLSKEVENRYRYSYFNVSSTRVYPTALYAKQAALRSVVSRMNKALEDCQGALKEIGDLPIE